MTSYTPQPGVFPGRPPCATCGAAFRLHRPNVAGLGPGDTADVLGKSYVTSRGLNKLAAMGALSCPDAYRPDDLATAQRALDDALASGDQARVFVARGDLQRVQGRGNRS